MNSIVNVSETDNVGLGNEVRVLSSKFWSVAALLHHGRGHVLETARKAFHNGKRIDVALEDLLASAIANPIAKSAEGESSTHSKVFRVRARDKDKRY